MTPGFSPAGDAYLLAGQALDVQLVLLDQAGAQTDLTGRTFGLSIFRFRDRTNFYSTSAVAAGTSVTLPITGVASEALFSEGEDDALGWQVTETVASGLHYYLQRAFAVGASAGPGTPATPSSQPGSAVVQITSNAVGAITLKSLAGPGLSIDQQAAIASFQIMTSASYPGRAQPSDKIDGSVNRSADLLNDVAAAKAAGKALVLPSGPFPVSGTLWSDPTFALKLFGQGRDKTLLHILPPSTGPAVKPATAPLPLFNVSNPPTAWVQLAQDVVRGSAPVSRVYLSSVVGLAAGMWAAIQDRSQIIYQNNYGPGVAHSGGAVDALGSTSGPYAEAYQCERVMIAAVTVTAAPAGYVDLEGDLEWDYQAATSYLKAWSCLAGVELAGFAVEPAIPPTTALIGYRMFQAAGGLDGLRISDMRLRHFDGNQIRIADSFRTRIQRMYWEYSHDELGGDPYCSSFVDFAQDWEVLDSESRDGRHLHTTLTQNLCEPAHGRVSRCTAFNHTNAPFDTHPGSRDVLFEHCRSIQSMIRSWTNKYGTLAPSSPAGWQLRGRRQRVHGHHSVGMYRGGSMFYGSDNIAESCFDEGSTVGLIIENTPRAKIVGGISRNPKINAVQVTTYRGANAMPGVVLDGHRTIGDCQGPAYQFNHWESDYVANVKAPDASVAISGVPLDVLNGGKLPTGFIAQSLDHRQIATGGLALVSGQMQVAMVELEQGVIISSLAWLPAAAATGTTHEWLALYDENRNLLTQSVDTGAINSPVATLANKPCPPIKTPYKGYYYIGLCQVATAPGSARGFSGAAPANFLTPPESGLADSGLTGTAPTVAAAFTSTVNLIWMAAGDTGRLPLTGISFPSTGQGGPTSTPIALTGFTPGGGVKVVFDGLPQGAVTNSALGTIQFTGDGTPPGMAATYTGMTATLIAPGTWGSRYTFQLPDCTITY